MKTAIITGVSGQDGLYLAKFLLEKNYKVVGTLRSYRRENTENFEYLGIENQVTIEELDLLDMANVIRIIQKYNPDEYIFDAYSRKNTTLSFATASNTGCTLPKNAANNTVIIALLSIPNCVGKLLPSTFLAPSTYSHVSNAFKLFIFDIGIKTE